MTYTYTCKHLSYLKPHHPVALQAFCTMARTKKSAIEEGLRKDRQAKEERNKARGVTKLKASKAPKNAQFVVFSREWWQNDGWHSDSGPGTTKADSVHKTLNAANKRAKDLFYKENPWGLEAAEIEAMEMDEECDEFGCVTYTAYPPDSEAWQVMVDMVGGKK